MGPKLKNQIKQNKKVDSKQNKDSYLPDDHNYRKFSEQLAKIGLALRDISGDGNCLFRALCDQLEGSESNHLTYRKSVCEYMRKNRLEFEPFVAALAEEIEDKAKKKSVASQSDLFEKYLQNLEQPGM
jgi:hypothetical protein